MVIEDFSGTTNVSFKVNGTIFGLQQRNSPNIFTRNRAAQNWDGPPWFQLNSTLGWRIEQLYLYPDLFPNPIFQAAIYYGGSSSQLNVNLTAGGHDRFVLKFTDASGGWTEGSLGLWLNTAFAPTAVVPRVSLASIAGGGIVEIPFSWFAGGVADVDRLTMGAVKLQPGESFTLRSLTTAGPPTPGDFDRDGDADGDDLIEWQRTVWRSTGAMEGRLSADANADGSVDGADYLAWQQAAAAGAGTISVPEPSALLIAICFIALLPAPPCGVIGRVGPGV